MVTNQYLIRYRLIKGIGKALRLVVNGSTTGYKSSRHELETTMEPVQLIIAGKDVGAKNSATFARHNLIT